LRISVACTCVLRACALPDQLRPAGDPTAQDPRLLIRQPHRRQEAAGEQPRQSARVDLVGLRARPGDPLDRLRIREHHPSDVRLDDPRDLERVAGRLQRDFIITAEALREQLKRRRRGLHPPRQPHLARLRDRDLAEVAMHVQPDSSIWLSMTIVLAVHDALSREHGRSDRQSSFR
jgi:hypothetical protein